MYFANGIAPGLLQGAAAIPPPAFVRRYNVYFQKDPPAFPAFLAPQAVSVSEAAALPLVSVP